MWCEWSRKLSDFLRHNKARTAFFASIIDHGHHHWQPSIFKASQTMYFTFGSLKATLRANPKAELCCPQQKITSLKISEWIVLMDFQWPTKLCWKSSLYWIWKHTSSTARLSPLYMHINSIFDHARYKYVKEKSRSKKCNGRDQKFKHALHLRVYVHVH